VHNAFCHGQLAVRFCYTWVIKGTGGVGDMAVLEAATQVVVRSMTCCLCAAFSIEIVASALFCSAAFVGNMDRILSPCVGPAENGPFIPHR
jgi:hypothetical protein